MKVVGDELVKSHLSWWVKKSEDLMLNTENNNINFSLRYGGRYPKNQPKELKLVCVCGEWEMDNVTSVSREGKQDC